MDVRKRVLLRVFEIREQRTRCADRKRLSFQTVPFQRSDAEVLRQTLFRLLGMEPHVRELFEIVTGTDAL